MIDSRLGIGIGTYRWCRDLRVLSLLAIVAGAACGAREVIGIVSTPPTGPTPVAVAEVAVSPASATISVGGSQQFTAQMRDGTGAILTGRVVTWRTSDSSVASMSSSGLLTAVKSGVVSVTAKSEDALARATVTVTRAVVTTVVVTPAVATLIVGDSLQLVAAPTDSGGRPVAERTVTWKSSDTTTVIISSAGMAVAKAAGSATITATSDGKNGTATVVVKSSLVADRNTLVAGLFHTCGLAASGTAYCWGHNGSDPAWGAGMLGDGSTTDRSSPTKVTGTIAFSVLEASAFFSCGLTGSGAAFCWGFNGAGQLGDGSYTTRVVPARVGGDIAFVSISGGYNHACALSTRGAAYCWGEGQQLPAPTANGLSFTAISSRGNFDCGLASGGTAYCWGDNSYGQLGDGTEYATSTPVAVRTNVVFSAISAGYIHTCALTPAGAAYCWGNNGLGQLGGTTEPISGTPSTVVGNRKFTSLTSGYFHTCGMTSDGDAYCWGYNGYGALGDGSTTNRSTPTLVSGGLKFAAVAAGGYHTCGLTAAGTAYCWGRNTFGALGDGSVTNRATPVPVSGGLVFRVP